MRYRCTKIFHAAHKAYPYSGYTLLVTCLLFVLNLIPASAAAGAIAQSYQAGSNDIAQGTLLSLESKGSTVVVPANSASNVANLVGIASDKPLIGLSNGNQESIQVVLSGTTDALISDINGAVLLGDKITASPLVGIGMKATNTSEIVGTSQADLNSTKTITKTIDGVNGKTKTVKVGLLPVAVNVAYYSTPSSESVSAFVPPFLQSLANSITGKEVPPLRVLIGTIIFLVGLATTLIMLYTGIRNGVISLGRNPLAESTLRRGLLDIIIAAVGIFTVTGVIVTAIIAA